MSGDQRLSARRAPEAEPIDSTLRDVIDKGELQKDDDNEAHHVNCLQHRGGYGDAGAEHGVAEHDAEEQDDVDHPDHVAVSTVLLQARDQLPA